MVPALFEGSRLLSGPEDIGSVLVLSLGSQNGSSRGVVRDGDVGELAVVGRAGGAGG